MPAVSMSGVDKYGTTACAEMFIFTKASPFSTTTYCKQCDYVNIVQTKVGHCDTMMCGDNVVVIFVDYIVFQKDIYEGFCFK